MDGIVAHRISVMGDEGIDSEAGSEQAEMGNPMGGSHAPVNVHLPGQVADDLHKQQRYVQRQHSEQTAAQKQMRELDPKISTTHAEKGTVSVDDLLPVGSIKTNTHALEELLKMDVESCKPFS